MGWVVDLEKHVKEKNISRVALFVDSFDSYYSLPGFREEVATSDEGTEALAALDRLLAKIMKACRQLVAQWKAGLTKDDHIEWWDPKYRQFYAGAEHRP